MSISQVLVNAEQPFDTSNIPQIGNRSNALRYQTSPQWQQDILGSALTITYDLGKVNYNDSTLQNATYQTVTSDLVSPDQGPGLNWSLHHQYRLYQYSQSGDQVWQLAEATLDLTLANGWTPFVAGGLESDVRESTDPALTDGIWTVGLRRDTSAVNFRVFFGERSFGSSWGSASDVITG